MIFKKIVFASDYRGIEMREELVRHAMSLGLPVQDIGIERGSSLDYVDISKLLVDEIRSQTGACGVIICGSGQGVTIFTNRSSEIRAAVCRTTDDVESVRSKLNANVLCLGSKNSSVSESIECLTAFLETEFIAGKHEKSVAKLGSKLTEHTYSGVNLIVRAMILHRGHILLTTATDSNKEFGTGLYFLPGGHVDYNEPSAQALYRELREEMNIEASDAQFVGALECSWDRKGQIYHELNVVYRVNIPDLSLENPPVAVDPFHRFVWCPLSEISAYKILPEKLVPLIQSESPLFLSQMIK